MRANYFPDQYVVYNDLNFTEASRIADGKLRQQANLLPSGGIYKDQFTQFSVLGGGIFGRPDEYAATKNCNVTLSDSDTLLVYPGKALDSDGNIIVIGATKTVTRGNSDVNFKWTSSLGNNYVKLRYAEASGSVGTSDDGTQYFTRYTDDYFIEIDNVHPTGSVGNPILLAQFTGIGSGEIGPGTLQDRRLYVRQITTADAVYLDPFNNPVAGITHLSGHVNATGSGVPAINNPHGLSYEDLGGLPESNPNTHRIQAHINGIIPFDRGGAALNSFKPSVINNNSPSAAVAFTAPDNTVISVDGQIITTSLDSLLGPDAFAIGGNTNYVACVNKLGETLWLTETDYFNNYLDQDLAQGTSFYTTGHKGTTVMPLATAIISAGGNTITVLDRRTFLTTHPKDIVGQFVENVEDPATTVLNRAFNLADNLNRIRYQIGRLVNGNPASWSGAPPLTAGASSNGDTYHGHNFDNLLDIKTSTVRKTGLEIVAGTGSIDNADAYHTHAKTIFKGSSLLAQSGFTFGGGGSTIPWVRGTGSNDHTFDYLNIGSGTPTSPITLPAGIFSVNIHVLIEGAAGHAMVGGLFVGPNLVAQDTVVSRTGSPYYSSIHMHASLELPSSDTIPVLMTPTLATTYTVLFGRMDITKLSDYPVIS